MFSIYADGLCVYNDVYPAEQYKVSSPRLKMADSAAGSLEMVLPPVNIAYDALKRMKTTVIVKRYDDEIWEGRIVEDSYNFYNERTVYCEGALAYLNDTCQPQREYKNTTLEIFLQSVFDIHNSKVPDNRKIYYDFQNVTGDIIERITTQYQKTLEVLNSVCMSYSCHMKLVRRKVEIGVNDSGEAIYETRKYVQFFKGPANTSLQTVEFGKNLLDYTSNYNLSELATVVLPLGATKTRADSSGVGNAIDLTVRADYNGDKGYGVDTVKTEFTSLNFENAIKNGEPRIIPIDGGYSYYTAILKIKASTNIDGVDTRNTVYLTSRMHGGRGMYLWITPDGNSYVSGRYSSEALGFTDMIEEAIDVPYITDESDESTRAAGYYILYVGSFGGDIQLRVNLKATVSDEMDEYYTVEDAMVSSVNLLDSIPEVENGSLSVTEGSIGNNEEPSQDDSKYIRTTNWINQNGSYFNGGNYSVNLKTSTGNVVQARVFHNNGRGNVYYDDWKNVPARFSIPSGENVETLKFAFRYAGTTADFNVGDITEFSVVSGERYGSLYVTAQSRNLFNDVVERGSIIDSGNLTGDPSSGTSLTELRNTKLLGVTVEGGDVKGFDAGQYLIHGTTVKDSADDNRVIEARVFHYDFESGDYKSMDDWSPIPKSFEITGDGEALRFSFRYSDESNINVTGLLDVMLEQGTLTPSMYEPANTSLEEYGWIETCITWDDVDNPDELYYRAKTYLASGQFDHMTLDITALDLGALGADVDALEIGDYIRVISAPHGLDRFFEITELDIPLAEPENMTFKLGTETQQTLTGITNDTNNELLSKIEGGLTGSSILKAAKTEAGRIILDGFTNSYMVNLLDDDDHQSGLGFFKVWSSADGDYKPYNNVPDAHWSKIYNNPNYANVACLLINSAGIVFYGNGIKGDPTITLVNSKGQIVADSIISGTMYADRILGGTLKLGVGENERGEHVNGSLVVKADVDFPFPEGDETRDEIVQINKDVGILQQGTSTEDNWLRQVKIFDGYVEGYIWHNDTYEQSGRLFMATAGQLGNGMIIDSERGRLEFRPHRTLGISVRGSDGLDKVGYNQSVTIGSVTLHFTHGILTQVDGV